MSEPSNSDRPELSPPPRAPRVASGTGSRGTARRSRARGGVAILVAGLLVMLAWVVIGLPRWVESRRAVEDDAAVPSVAESSIEAPRPDPPAPIAPEPATALEPSPDLAAPASEGPPPPARAAAVPARPTTAAEPDPFGAAMTRALEGLGRGDLDAARRAADEAARHRADDPALVDVRARIDAAQTGSRLATLRDEAREAERAEDWRGAVTRYERALALDPNVRFAREGVERAGARADLAERMAFHVAHPERLTVPEVLDEAVDTLDEASDVAPAGPRHEELSARLAAIVAAARSPVPVVLESDGRTEVSIYHVGRIGAFERHELELRPGSYTVVGTRRGFRDVRLTLVVEPGEDPVALRVACSEEI